MRQAHARTEPDRRRVQFSLFTLLAAGGWGRTAEEQPTIAYGHHRQSAPSRHPWAMVAVLGAICRSDSREHSGRSPGRSTPATLPYDESIPPASAKASDGRCGITEPDRLESGRWHVANKGTICATWELQPCDCRSEEM